MATKQVKVSDLVKADEMGIEAHLYCTKCHSTYSATPGDYFMTPASHVFKCCRRNNLLVTRRTLITEVEL